MASSGTSSGGSAEVVDPRKRRRMQSNRESARRSRQRKQKHLDDLTAQVSQLRKENAQVLTALNVTTQHYLGAEAENTVLRAQVMELSHRLQSLNEILNCMSTSEASNELFCGGGGDDGMMVMMTMRQQQQQPWSMMGVGNLQQQLQLQHPIMAASADMYQYC